jgi:hypothetical protein
VDTLIIFVKKGLTVVSWTNEPDTLISTGWKDAPTVCARIISGWLEPDTGTLDLQTLNAGHAIEGFSVSRRKEGERDVHVTRQEGE